MRENQRRYAYYTILFLSLIDIFIALVVYGASMFAYCLSELIDAIVFVIKKCILALGYWMIVVVLLSLWWFGLNVWSE
jgi:hypothetical protein